MIFNMTGGIPLNFKVKQYASELLLPATAAKNTIAVFTSTPISSYIFSAAEPDASEEGMVWFATGAASPIEFSATKKNPVMVYPSGAKQYISGSWVTVAAKIYQGGAWVDWLLYLFKNGDECEDITGGWTFSGYAYAGYAFQGFSISNNALTLIRDGAFTAGCGTQNLIDLTDYTILCADVTEHTGARLTLAVAENKSFSSMIVSAQTTEAKTIEVDISNLSGQYYIVLMQYNDAATSKIARVYLR